ncbi:MAG TPA: SBBP repeat-containing protein [Rhodanobacteraceae bacterium]
MIDGTSFARVRALVILFVLLASWPAAAAQLDDAGYLGGNTTDQAFSVAVDAAGNTYVAGSTESANFPTVNALQPALKGATDAFVAKISPDGTTLKYATYLGGSKLDVVYGIAVDAGGSVYVAGATNSSDFPVTPGVLQNHLAGPLFDAFVAKLSPSGALVYSTYLGGSYVDIADAIAVDAGRNAYLVGYTCSYDFPTRKPFQPFLQGGPPGCFAGQDAFVAKISPDATSLVYSTFFGGTGQDEATALALDANGGAVVAGYSASNDLPLAGFALTPYRGGRDAFVARFDASGTLGYASYLGGTGDDTATGLAVGAAGDVFVTGYTSSPDFPIANAFQNALLGLEDGFVARIALAQTSTALVYSTYLGGGDGDRLQAIATDAGGNAYVAGYTESLDFPTVVPTQPALGGARDAIVARLDPAGVPTFATFLGGSDIDTGWGLALHAAPSGVEIRIGGETLSTDLGTAGAFQPNAQGAADGFAASIATP